jgi:hypothetical protein
MSKINKCIAAAYQINSNIDMALRFKASGKLGFNAMDYIADSILNNSPEFIKALIGKNDPENLELYKHYLDTVVTITTAKVARLSSTKFDNKITDAYSKLGIPMDTMRKELSDLIESKLSKIDLGIIDENKSLETLTQSNITGSEKDLTSTDATVEIKNNVDVIRDLGVLSFRPLPLINNSQANYTEIINHYFTSNPQLIEEFEKLFKDTFMNSIFDTNLYSETPYRNVNDAILNSKSIMESLAQGSSLTLENDIANYADSDVSIRNGYYAQIINNHFSNIASDLLPGIDFTKFDFNKENNSSISFSASMSSDSSYDMMNQFIKQLLLNTNKLSVNKQDLSTSMSTGNSRITESNINYALKTTHDLDQSDFDQWCKNFKYEIDILSNSEEKDILSSFYYKYFATEPYMVDNIAKQSLNYIAKNSDKISEEDRQNIHNIVTNTYNHFAGNLNAESNIFINDKITLTQHLHAEAASQLIESFKNGLVLYTGGTQTLKADVLKKISIEQNNENLIIKINKHEIKVSLNKNNGLTYIQVEEPLSDAVNASLMKILLGDNSLINKRPVLKDYIINNKGNDFELTNLIANIAWVLKSKQDPKAIQDIINSQQSNALKPVIFDSNQLDLKDTLFNAIDKGNSNSRSNIVPKLIESSKRISMAIKSKRLNLNRDIVSNIMKSNMMYSTESNIREVEKKAKEGVKTLLGNNLFVKRKFKVVQYYALEGLKIGDTSKTLSQLSEKEQQHLLISSFASSAITSNYRQGLVLLTIPSDKSNITAPLIESLGNNLDFMPVHNVNGFVTLNKPALVSQLIDTKKTFHTDLANQIVSLWKAEISKNMSSNVELLAKLNSVKDINELQNFAKENKIPVDILKSLTSEIHYKTAYSKDGNYAVIGDIFLSNYNTWNDPTKSSDKVKELERDFFNQLIKDGYYKNKKLTIDLPYDINKALSNRFPKNPTSSLLLSYFYASATMTSEVNNLVGASIYQFKDGERDSKSKIEKTAKILFDKKVAQAAIDKKSIDEAAVYEEVYASVRHNELYSNMYMNQIKRNAPLTSGIEKLRLASKKEKGLMFEKVAYSAVVEDNVSFVELLGALSPDLKQESTDAVCFVSWFYHKKMANSIGGVYSTNFEEDAPLKDITLSKDSVTGVLTIQKKASFKLSIEHLKNGSPLLQKAFIKMHNTIKFNNPFNTNGIICSSVYDVWVANGGWGNMQTAFEKTAEFLAENTEYRNQYIEILNFKSAEKTGNSSINSFESLNDLNQPLLYKEINMLNHGNILRAGHDTDTTDKTGNKSDLSTPTQIVTALGLEGATQDLSNEVYKALEHISINELNAFNEDIKDKAVHILQKKIETSDNTLNIGAEKIANIFLLVNKHKLHIKLSENEESELLGYLTEYSAIEAAKNYIFKDITKKALATRETHGPGTDLINKVNPDWGSLQLKSVLRTALASHLDSLTIKLKMSGGQHVVATAEKFLQVFTTPNGARLTRSSYNKVAPKNTLITKNNRHLYSFTDLVTVDNDPKLYAFGDLTEEILENNIVNGIDLESENLISELSFMKYFRYDENGKRLYFGTAESNTDVIYNQLKNAVTEGDRRNLEHEIQIILNKDHWITESTEFITPMMHLASYNLKTSDDITDIIGDVDVYAPNSEKEIINNSESFFRKRLNEIASNNLNLSLLVKSKNKQGLLLDLFSTRRNGELRIKLATTSGIVDIDKTIKNLKYNLKGVNSIEADTFISEIRESLKSTEQNILKAEGDPKDVSLYNSTLGLLGISAKAKQRLVIDKLAISQSNAFYKVLEFVTCRIPSQGKQSGTVGRSIGFINDTKNTFYTGVVFTKLTGQDHDNDKLNTVVLSVNEFGEIYDYTKYLDENGKISSDKQEEVKRNIITELSEKFKSESVSELSNRINNALASEKNYLINALKNYAYDKMKETFKSSKNAIESQTPISMDSIQSAVSKVGTIYETSKEDIEEDDKGISNLSAANFSPDNIAGVPSLIKILTVGKGVVGIAANNMKIFGAVFNANSQDIEKTYTRFFVNPEMENLPFAQSKEYMDLYKETFDLQNDYDSNNMSHTVKIFVEEKDGSVSVKKSDGIANIKSVNFEKSKDIAVIAVANKFYEENNSLVPDSEAFNDALELEVRKYLDAKNITTQQAWEYISELLSAATDNAKEFILGRIGADMSTSGIISNMLMLGFDLKTSIDLINNPTVQEIFKKSERTRELNYSGRAVGIREGIKEHIRTKAGKYTFDAETLNATNRAKASKNRYNKLLENKKNSVQFLSEGAKPFSALVQNDINSILSKDITVSPSEYATMCKKLTDKYPAYSFIRTSKLVSDNKNLRNLINIVKNSDTTYVLGYKQENDYKSVLAAAALYFNKTVYFLNAKGEVTDTINGSSLPVALGSNYSIINNLNVDLNPATINDSLFDENNGINSFDLMYTMQVESAKQEFEKAENFKALVLNKFLLDGPRQLLQFLDALDESRLLGGVLNINQGIKITDWEESAYLAKVQTSLENGTQSSLSQKIDDLLNNTNIPNNLHKFYNIPFVLSKNPHFLASIKVQLFNHIANNELNNIQNIITSLAQDFDSSTESTEDESLMMLNEYRMEKSYKSIAEIPYNYAIYKMYNRTDLPDDFKAISFKLENNTFSFNLSNAEERFSFLNTLPQIIDELKELHPALKNNLFLQSLRIDSLVDSFTGNSMPIIKTGNLMELEESERAKLKLSFDTLNNDKELEVKSLYNALVHYSIIMNKGGNDKNSFSLLINQLGNIFNEWHNTLSSLTKEEVLSAVSTTGDASILLSPESIMMKSTAQRQNVSFDDIDLTSDFEADLAEQGIFSRKSGNRKNKFLHAPKKTRTTPNIIRSKEYPDLVFMWGKDHNNEEKFMLITPKANPKSVILDFSNNNFGDLNRVGWQLGHTANIDQFRVGQVVYPIIGSNPEAYAVIVDNKWINVLKDDLKSFNPNMVFDGLRIGKRASNDSDTNETEDYKLSGLTKDLNMYIGGVSYRITEEIPSNTKKGDTIVKGQTVRYGQQNIPVDVEYLGNVSSDEILNTYFSGMSYEDKRLVERNKKNGKDQSYHVVQVKLLERPKIISSSSFLKVITDSKEANAVLEKGATYFMSKPELTKLNRGNNIISLGIGRNSQSFILSKINDSLYTLDEYVKYTGSLSTAALNLGISEYELTKKLANPEEKKTFIYKLYPYDSKSNFINSRQEINMVGKIDKPALEGVNIYQLKHTKLGSDLSEVFGYTLKDFSSSTSSRRDLEKVKQALKEQDSFDDSIIDNNIDLINSLISSSTNILFTNMKDNTSVGLKGNARLLNEFLELNKLSIDDVKNRFDSIKQSLNLNNKDLEIAFTLLSEHIEKNKSRNQSKNFTSYTNNLELQAAILSGKPLFVFNKNRDQWQEYNYKSNMFEDCNLPLFVGNEVTMSGVERQLESNHDLEILTSLLTHNNKFRELSDGTLGKFSVHGELSLSGVPINEEINSSINSYNSKSDSTEDFYTSKSDEMFLFKNEKNNPFISSSVSGDLIRKVITLDGQEFPLEDFREQENVVLTKYADGAVKIILTTSYGEVTYVSMSPELIAEYSNFTGEEQYDNFKFKIGDKYFIFNNILKIKDVRSFELRDQLKTEKEQLKKLGLIAADHFNNVITPLYKSLRFPKNADPSKSFRFKGIDSYNGFITWISSDNDFDFSEEEKVLVEKLIEENKKYKNMVQSTRDFVEALRAKFSSSLDAKASNISFTNPSTEVLVFLTDGFNFGQNTLIEKLQRDKGLSLALSNFDTQLAYDKTNSLFYLKLFTENKIADNGALIKSIGKLLYTAQEDLDKNKDLAKTFILDLPVNGLEEKVFGDMTGYDAGRAISRALSLLKSRNTWPSNLVLSSRLAEFVNSTDGFINLATINRTKPFEVVHLSSESNNIYNFRGADFMQRNMTSGSASTIASTWANWLGTESKNLYAASEIGSIVQSRFNGNEEKAFKSLLTLWAQQNPKAFNRIAFDIGNKSILDYYGKGNKFSVASALASVLNDKFVDNKWIELPANILDRDIDMNQSIIGLKPGEVKFNGEGKALIVDNQGVQFIMEMIYENHAPINNSTSLSLINDLGLDFDNLPEFTSSSFNIAKIVKVVNKKSTYEFAPSQMLELIDKANKVELSEEHRELFKNATHIIPIDILSNITTPSSERIVSNNYITNILSSIDDNIHTNYTNTSEIVLIGTKLSDKVYNTDSVQYAFDNHKFLIDKAIAAGASFIIGSETGIEAQAVSYILSSGTYSREGNKLVKKPIIRENSTTKVIVETDLDINNFNANNDINRGQGFSGLLEAKLGLNNKTKNNKVFELEIDMDNEVIPMSSTINNFESILRSHTTIGNVDNASEIEIENMNNSLISEEELFLESLIKLNILNKYKEQHSLLDSPIESISDLDNKFDTLNKNDEYIEKHNEVFKIFNKGRLNIAIRSRAITLNYLKNYFPELIAPSKDLESLKKSKLQFTYSDTYKEFLNSYKLTENSFKEMLSSSTTVEDLYNILSTTGDNIILNNGIPEGQIAAKIIRNNLPRIKALSNFDTLFVLDYSAIYGSPFSNQEDFTKKNNKLKITSGNEAEIKLASAPRFTQMFKYLKEYGLITPDILNDKKLTVEHNRHKVSLDLSEGSPEVSINNAITEIKTLIYESVKSLYNETITKTNFTKAETQGDVVESFHLKQDFLASKHIARNRSLWGNPWIYMLQNNRSTTEVQLDEKGTFSLGKYSAKTSDELFTVTTPGKLNQVRFMPIALEEAGIFFLAHKYGSNNAVIVEYLGKPHGIVDINDFFDKENIFKEVARINITKSLDNIVPLNKAASYGSKEGNIFAFLYTGNNEENIVDGPFIIEKDGKRTLAVKYSTVDPTKIIDKYFIDEKDKMLISGQKHIWTSFSSNTNGILENPEVKPKNNSVLPTEKEIDEQQKKCEE